MLYMFVFVSPSLIYWSLPYLLNRTVPFGPRATSLLHFFFFSLNPLYAVLSKQYVKIKYVFLKKEIIFRDLGKIHISY